MSAKLTVREAMRERAKAGEFWRGLDTSSRLELGDQLVLGELDWRDWFASKPTSAFLEELDNERILWESCHA